MNFYVLCIKYLLVREMFRADAETNEMDILCPVNFSCNSCGFQEIKRNGANVAWLLGQMYISKLIFLLLVN
jgi:hypothetical protein